MAQGTEVHAFFRLREGGRWFSFQVGVLVYCLRLGASVHTMSRTAATYSVILHVSQRGKGKEPLLETLFAALSTQTGFSGRRCNRQSQLIAPDSGKTKRLVLILSITAKVKPPPSAHR